MRYVLDSGALIALERNDREMWRRLQLALKNGSVPRTHGGVVGQVWRGSGPRQARLATALAHIEIRAIDETLGRSAGDLLGRVDGDDVIDAALVLLAEDGDLIITSDPDDVEELAAATRRDIEIVVV